MIPFLGSHIKLFEILSATEFKHKHNHIAVLIDKKNMKGVNRDLEVAHTSEETPASCVKVRPYYLSVRSNLVNLKWIVLKL